METIEYELCENCEKVMEVVNAFGLTTEEMKEQQAEFDFGLAISFLKEGERITRKNWNGEVKYIYLVNQKEDFEKEVTAKIAMKCIDNTVSIGYVASMEDILAENWILV